MLSACMCFSDVKLEVRFKSVRSGVGVLRGHDCVCEGSVEWNVDSESVSDMKVRRRGEVVWRWSRCKFKVRRIEVHNSDCGRGFASVNLAEIKQVSVVGVDLFREIRLVAKSDVLALSC